MPYIGSPGVPSGSDELLRGITQRRQMAMQERLARRERPHTGQEG